MRSFSLLQSLLEFFFASALLSGGCSLPSPSETPLSPPRLVSSPPLGYPGVENLAIGVLPGDTFIFVLSFSMPMEMTSVSSALTVRRATEPVTTGMEGNALPLPPTALKWNATETEVSFSLQLREPTPIVVVLTPLAHSKSGMPLDGNQGVAESYTPQSYHRIEEDGFSGPSTYISLPFYPQGSAALSSHPSYLLSQSRPILTCYPQGNTQVTPVTEGSLGAFLTSKPQIFCTLLDRRFPSQRAGGFERITPRAWDPEQLPEAEFKKNGQTIPGTTSLGHRITVSTPKVKIMAIENSLALRWQGTIESAEGSRGEFYLAPARAPEPLLPIVSFSQNLLIFASLRYRFPRVFSRPGDTRLTITEATFLSGEILGDILHIPTVSGYEGRIVAHEAGTIIADSPPPCGFECPLVINLDISRHYSVGDEGRIVSPDLTFTPKEPLAPGLWTLRIRGGKDLFGLARTDGIRDGNEGVGIPDDDQVFTLMIP